MRNVHPRKLQVYQTQNGREPFTEWLKSIRDRRTRTRIRERLERLEDGNFGDCQSVGAGVYEMRLPFGAGYRIYFGEIDNTIVLLLCGGDKSSQAQDIERAKTYWLEYKETHQ
jgi:putative addiction module killer protein